MSAPSRQSLQLNNFELDATWPRNNPSIRWLAVEWLLRRKLARRLH
jgi:hypothetical protein